MFIAALFKIAKGYKQYYINKRYKLPVIRKISMRNVMYTMISIINIAIHYTQKLLKEQNPEFSSSGKFFSSYILYVYDRCSQNLLW